MMKRTSVILAAAVLAATVAGCGSGPAVRNTWEAELRGALSPDCRNIEHLGYGIHYDIIYDARQSPPREGLAVAARLAGRSGGGQRGE